MDFRRHGRRGKNGVGIFLSGGMLRWLVLYRRFISTSDVHTENSRGN
jgi:hypothetical protein